MKFLKNNEMKTLNDRVRNPGPEWARQCTRKGESSNVDFLLLVVDVEVVRNRKCMYAQRTKKLQITCLIWTDSQQTRVTKNRRGRKLYRWRIDTNTRSERKTAGVPRRDSRERRELSELLGSIGTTMNGTERHSSGARTTKPRPRKDKVLLRIAVTVVALTSGVVFLR